MDKRKIEPEASELGHSGDESHLLREVMRTYQVLMNVFSRQVGMPGSQLNLLRLLAINHPGEMGILEMARRLGINAAAVSRQVKEMAAQNLVARRPEPQDGRRTLIKLTPEGLRAFHQIHERAHEFEKSLEANLSSAEIATAAKVLEQLRASLEDYSF